MGKIDYASLKPEYAEMFKSCSIIFSRLSAVTGAVSKVMSGRQRYEQVSKKLGTIPWYFIGCIHNMERGCSFKHHLHNGDPLTGRTHLVPAGRPIEPPWGGEVAYSWEQSAIDALKMKKLDEWTDWSISGLLYQMEKFNGFGYRQYHPHVKSPYLWSFTNKYTRGKYIGDGKWSEVAVSEQVGCAAILKNLEMQGLLT